MAYQNHRQPKLRELGGMSPGGTLVTITMLKKTHGIRGPVLGGMIDPPYVRKNVWNPESVNVPRKVEKKSPMEFVPLLEFVDRINKSLLFMG